MKTIKTCKKKRKKIINYFILDTIFLNFCRDDVQKLFEEKDKDHDGYLSFEEFTGQETKIEIAFKAMDKDGDGFISKPEFRQVCKSLTEDQVEAAFNKFDKEGNGMLNYREFCKMMNTRY